MHFVLEKEKLNGTNYTDWIHNMRIILRAEKKRKRFWIPHYQKSLLKMRPLLKELLIGEHVMQP